MADYSPRNRAPVIEMLKAFGHILAYRDKFPNLYSNVFGQTNDGIGGSGFKGYVWINQTYSDIDLACLVITCCYAQRLMDYLAYQTYGMTGHNPNQVDIVRYKQMYDWALSISTAKVNTALNLGQLIANTWVEYKTYSSP